MDFEKGYREGLLCWIPCPHSGWTPGVIEEVNEKYLLVDYEGQSKKFTEKLFLVSEKEEELNKDDLCKLDPLHEPAVLECIHTRFMNEQFYTSSGAALIAMNPMRPVPLYGKNEVDKYHSVEALEDLLKLPPHIYAVAEIAYRNLTMGTDATSVIVSGESGSGKTVTSRYILQFMVMVAKEKSNDPTNRVEDHLISTNPILESFGNAATLRNANSSRFGKYLRVQFDDENHVCGARIDTYLLEKSRVVYHAVGERTYHIFYQLCAGASEEQKEKYGLRKSEGFHYSRSIQCHGECTDVQKCLRCAASRSGSVSSTGRPQSLNGRRPTMDKRSAKKMTDMSCLYHPSEEDDRRDFEETSAALSSVGLSLEEQEDIWQTTAGILHLGEVIPTGSRKGSSKIEFTGENSTQKVAELLGISAEDLARNLTNKRIITRNEVIYSPTSREDAEQLRDSLAKDLYRRLFVWLVHKINTLASSAAEESFIGILDIYGFEKFETNSLEQLCINYANEKLQQHFVSVVFRLEQQIYTKEGVQWDILTYTDNRLCISLIEDRPGILALLDEQCSLKRAVTHEAYTERLYECLTTNKYFLGEKAGSRTGFFTIKHYAMDVKYDTTLFLTKNLDYLGPEYVELLSESTRPFIAQLFTSEDKSKKSTITSQFKNSLGKLIQTLSSTETHFIRCLKPNKQQSGFLSAAATTVYQSPKNRKKYDAEQKRAKKGGSLSFDGSMVLDQLHASGIIDVVRIGQASYPHKIPYKDFIERFDILIRSSEKESSSRNVAEKLVNRLCQPLEPDIQFGRTMIFLRTSKMYVLEHSIYLRQSEAAVTIQAYFKMLNVRATMKQWKEKSIIVQKHVRCYLQVLWYKKACQAILKVQAYLRMRNALSAYNKAQRVILHIQTWSRGFLARTAFAEQKASLLSIQAFGRMVVTKKKYQRTRFSLIQIQSFGKMIVQVNTFKKTLSFIKNLQCHCLGFYIRRSQERSKRAVIYMQAGVRCILQMIKYKRMKRAAIKIQSHIRARLQVKEFQSTMTILVHIQAFSKGFLERQKYNEKQAAILKIQSYARCILAMKSYQVTREKVILLQSYLRMRMKNKNYLQTLHLLVGLQSHIRGEMARNQYHRKLEATTTIQAYARCLSQKKKYKKACKAIITVQSYLRMRHGQMVYEQNVKNIVSIQSCIRGNLSRITYQNKLAAIVRIQSLFRCLLAKKKYKKACNAIVTVQSYLRMRIDKKTFESQHSLLCGLQSCCLTYLVQEYYVHSKPKVILMQKVTKGYLKQKLYKKKKAAAFLLQAVVRVWLQNIRIKKHEAQELKKMQDAMLRIQLGAKGISDIGDILNQVNTTINTIDGIETPVATPDPLSPSPTVADDSSSATPLPFKANYKKKTIEEAIHQAKNNVNGNVNNQVLANANIDSPSLLDIAGAVEAFKEEKADIYADVHALIANIDESGTPTSTTPLSHLSEVAELAAATSHNQLTENNSNNNNSESNNNNNYNNNNNMSNKNSHVTSIDVQNTHQKSESGRTFINIKSFLSASTLASLDSSSVSVPATPTREKKRQDEKHTIYLNFEGLSLMDLQNLNICVSNMSAEDFEKMDKEPDSVKQQKCLNASIKKPKSKTARSNRAKNRTPEKMRRLRTTEISNNSKTESTASNSATDSPNDSYDSEDDSSQSGNEQVNGNRKDETTTSSNDNDDDGDSLSSSSDSEGEKKTKQQQPPATPQAGWRPWGTAFSLNPFGYSPSLQATRSYSHQAKTTTNNDSDSDDSDDFSDEDIKNRRRRRN